MKEIEINTWNEFQDNVFAECWNSAIMRHRSNYVFRGLSCSQYSLLTSLQRTCKGKIYLEKSLIRNFKKYASVEINDPENFWEVISLGQHHGLPTRLLDWSFSPFVALHFATEDYSHYEEDGAIWCLDFVKCKSYLPVKLLRVLEENDANNFSVDLLNEHANNLTKLSQLQADPFILFFEPPSIDNRIVNQFALFSVSSNPNTPLEEWLASYPDIYYKIIIPANKKLEFRDKLDQINMSERYIYPGLDGLCKWLARHYTPTNVIYPNYTDIEINKMNT